MKRFITHFIILILAGSAFAQRRPIVVPDFDPSRPTTAITSRLHFTDVTEVAGLARSWGIRNPTPGSMSELFGGGVAAGDYDGDGDIVITW